jgi:hypothetical protein
MFKPKTTIAGRLETEVGLVSNQLGNVSSLIQ